jgi:hypothetical protein
MARKVTDTRPAEVRRADWLRKYPDKFLACRQGHAFPRPVPGRKMPRTTLEPWHDPEGERTGCYYVEQSCSNCGRIRWKITGSQGSYYSGSTQWHYKDPKGYASPPGLGLIYADYADLLWERLIEGDHDTARAIDEQQEEQDLQAGES